MKLTYLLFAALVLGTGCATAEPGDQGTGAPATPAEVDPVGSYAFTTTVQGMAVDGQLRITGARGSWGGAFYTDVTGELPLSSVAVEGQTVHITANTPDGMVRVRLLFVGDEFTGDWSLGAEGASLRGRRLER